MNYQVLARKWRPHRFEDMVGQEHVLRALTNALDKNRLHHAYLFTGTRGVGKTTIARIFAKSLNCEKGVSASPCGECSRCQDIDAGRFFDLIEVDAASRTKVDQTRELLENVPYAPSSGRYKVYLIDEVHMFSDHSFNALLKTLEEPPEHVKFLLATTDPQKVPVTVLSRCLQFNLKRLPERQIAGYLSQVVQREECQAEDSALAHIARAADGSMRDALSLLDQAIAFGEGKVLASEVESMLGRPSPDRVLDLVTSLAEGEPAKVMQLVSVFAEYAPDFSGLLADLLSVLHQVALLQSVPGTKDRVSFDAHRIHELSVRIPAEDIQLFYQIGLIGRRDIALAADMQEGFEMTLLRMLAFRPAADDGEIRNRLHSAALKNPSPGNRFEKNQVAAVIPPRETPPDSAKEVPSGVDQISSGSEHMAALKASLGDENPRTTQKKSLEKTDVVKHVSRSSDSGSSKLMTVALRPAADHSTTKTSAPVDWHLMVTKMDLAGITLELANNCLLISKDAHIVRLALVQACQSLLQPSAKQQLEQALCRYFAATIKLDITIEKAELETPARIKQREMESRLLAARESISTDPVVQKICSRLDAEVQVDSIKPRG